MGNVHEYRTLAPPPGSLYWPFYLKAGYQEKRFGMGQALKALSLVTCNCLLQCPHSSALSNTINIKRGFETKNQKQSGRKTMASTESCFNWKSGRDRNISKKILTSLPIMFPLRNRLTAHTWIFLTESQCHFKQIACYPHKSYSYSATSNRRPSSRQSA